MMLDGITVMPLLECGRKTRSRADSVSLGPAAGSSCWRLGLATIARAISAGGVPGCDVDARARCAEAKNAGLAWIDRRCRPRGEPRRAHPREEPQRVSACRPMATFSTTGHFGKSLGL